MRLIYVYINAGGTINIYDGFSIFALNDYDAQVIN